MDVVVDNIKVGIYALLKNPKNRIVLRGFESGIEMERIKMPLLARFRCFASKLFSVFDYMVT